MAFCGKKSHLECAGNPDGSGNTAFGWNRITASRRRDPHFAGHTTTPRHWSL